MRRRDDADLEAGTMSVFTIRQGFLLGVTLCIALPSLMVFLSLVLPVKLTRIANIALAVIYGLTIVGGAVGEWNYYILGSAIEVALLAGIAYYAWTWPKTTGTRDRGHCPARRECIAPGAMIHTGRTSGRTYRTPLDAHRLPDGYLFIPMYGPRTDRVKNARTPPSIKGDSQLLRMDVRQLASQS